IVGIGDDVAWRFEGGLARRSSERLAGTDSDEPLVCPNYLLAFMGRLYSEFRNAMRSAFWASDKALKKFLENVPPTPAWRWIASLKVNDNPSCINSGRVRTPQSGGVRIMFLVPWPPFWTIPSPVPMSCNRKSLNGRMFLLPRAAGTVNAPRLITVPGAAVFIEVVWQIEHAAC